MGHVGIGEMAYELGPSIGSGKGAGEAFKTKGMTKGTGKSEFTKGNSTNRSVVRDEAGEAAMEADAERVGHSVAEGQPASAEVCGASLRMPSVCAP